ncbi:heme-dependent oxidative N-demethylase subunit alpha family protein, partial [Mesorhizobium sp.]
LCFPSSWSLREKFGKPLQEIHEPVPGFGPGTRPAELINRMFDGLQGQAVERFNWSIQADDRLYHPLSNVERIDRATNRPSRFPDGDVNAHAFIRVERQTLRKLPVSRDILFTIRIHLDPLKLLADHPDRATLAASFAEQLLALDQQQLDYKGLTADRDRLVALLGRMAGSA